MDRYKIIWKTIEIGYLIKVIPDMWYLEGVYQPNTTDLSKRFADLVSKFDFKSVIADPTKGIRIKLQKGKETPMDVLVVSLNDKNELVVRQILSENGVDWLVKNVPEDK